MSDWNEAKNVNSEIPGIQTEQLDEFTQAVAKTMDLLRVWEEAARGFETEMLNQGWSESFAEQAAFIILMNNLQGQLHRIWEN